MNRPARWLPYLLLPLVLALMLVHSLLFWARAVSDGPGGVPGLFTRAFVEAFAGWGWAVALEFGSLWAWLKSAQNKAWIALAAPLMVASFAGTVLNVADPTWRNEAVLAELERQRGQAEARLQGSAALLAEHKPYTRLVDAKERAEASVESLDRQILAKLQNGQALGKRQATLVLWLKVAAVVLGYLMMAAMARELGKNTAGETADFADDADGSTSGAGRQERMPSHMGAFRYLGAIRLSRLWSNRRGQPADPVSKQADRRNPWFQKKRAANYKGPERRNLTPPLLGDAAGSRLANLAGTSPADGAALPPSPTGAAPVDASNGGGGVSSGERRNLATRPQGGVSTPTVKITAEEWRAANDALMGVARGQIGSGTQGVGDAAAAGAELDRDAVATRAGGRLQATGNGAEDAPPPESPGKAGDSRESEAAPAVADPEEAPAEEPVDERVKRVRAAIEARWPMLDQRERAVALKLGPSGERDLSLLRNHEDRAARRKLDLAGGLSPSKATRIISERALAAIERAVGIGAAAQPQSARRLAIAPVERI